ncbi:MAG TPA: trypsin-like peptidase domain-containing protein [Thermoleophilaceae bacterium]|nr:trypsin-like peptidase domain-containing protein [Thermoleophilaceae bacterium]
MSRQRSLWIDPESARDKEAGPFSSARWRRQALEAQARNGRPEEPEPAGPPERPRRRWLPLAALAVGLVALALASLALLDGGGPDESDVLPAAGGGRLAPTQIGRVYDSAGPGVVSVQAGPRGGTGFVVRKDGTIVTNAHVVSDAQTAQVRFGDSGETVEADVLGSDISSDLAVLRVDPGSVGPLRPLPLAHSERVKVGDAVVAIGHPFGLDRTATAGIVSGVGREIRAPDGFQIDEVIQTDAAINPGNSGGPLLDAKGRVVGVNSQIATGGGGGNVGIGFAVPSNTVREVLPALSRGERIKRPFLGVTTAPHREGAVVVDVTPGSPAESAGLSAGDVITGIDGRPVRDPDDVADAINGLEPGDEVEVEASRDGDERSFDVELEARPGGP